MDGLLTLFQIDNVTKYNVHELRQLGIRPEKRRTLRYIVRDARFPWVEACSVSDTRLQPVSEETRGCLLEHYRGIRGLVDSVVDFLYTPHIIIRRDPSSYPYPFMPHTFGGTKYAFGVTWCSRVRPPHWVFSELVPVMRGQKDCVEHFSDQWACSHLNADQRPEDAPSEGDDS